MADPSDDMLHASNSLSRTNNKRSQSDAKREVSLADDNSSHRKQKLNSLRSASKITRQAAQECNDMTAEVDHAMRGSL